MRKIVKSYPYDVRVMLLACILPSVALQYRSQPWHAIILSVAAGLLIWGIVLMYLRKTGRSNWNGPSWGETLRTSPRARRLLPVVPALCAAWIPILLLFNRRWQLSDGQLGTACGVLLGIAFALLVMIKSKRNYCCEPHGAASTHPGSTKSIIR
jgi:uncharacterized membrane protein YbhN (UPF0104 family)